MEKQNILTADLLDILFEGKNKTYGAYELRKSYDKADHVCDEWNIFYLFVIYWGKYSGRK